MIPRWDDLSSIMIVERAGKTKIGGCGSGFCGIGEFGPFFGAFFLPHFPNIEKTQKSTILPHQRS